MTIANARIGSTATTKVGRHMIEVEILAFELDRYKVKSLSTGREFYSACLYNINNATNTEETMPEEEHDATTAAEAAENATVTAAAPKKRSLFDAAVEVLKQSEQPLNTKDIVVKAVELGLWESTGAKTPEQTLYSSIFREIATKPHPRIVKSEQKGKFQYNG